MPYRVWMSSVGYLSISMSYYQSILSVVSNGGMHIINFCILEPTCGRIKLKSLQILKRLEFVPNESANIINRPTYCWLYLCQCRTNIPMQRTNMTTFFAISSPNNSSLQWWFQYIFIIPTMSTMVVLTCADTFIDCNSFCIMLCSYMHAHGLYTRRFWNIPHAKVIGIRFY